MFIVWAAKFGSCNNVVDQGTPAGVGLGAHLHRPGADHEHKDQPQVPPVEDHPGHGEEVGLPYVAGAVRVAQALPGLVPENLPGHPGEPDPAVRPHPLHRRRHPPHQ